MVCPWLHMGTWPKNVQKSSCHHQHSWKNSEKPTTSGRGGQATSWMTGSSLLKLKFSLSQGSWGQGESPLLGRIYLRHASSGVLTRRGVPPSAGERALRHGWATGFLWGSFLHLWPHLGSLLSVHAPSSHCLFWLLMLPYVLWEFLFLMKIAWCWN